jgi:hypothetical protein
MLGDFRENHLHVAVAYLERGPVVGLTPQVRPKGLFQGLVQHVFGTPTGSPR